MPIFNVTIGREIIETVTVAVEADAFPALRDIPVDKYYELLAPIKKLSQWSATINDIWIDDVQESHKKNAELTFKDNKLTVYEDPRQIKMFPEEKENA